MSTIVYGALSGLSERKLLLIAIACYRCLPDKVRYESADKLVDLMETYLDTKRSYTDIYDQLELHREDLYSEYIQARARRIPGKEFSLRLARGITIPNAERAASIAITAVVRDMKQAKKADNILEDIKHSNKTVIIDDTIIGLATTIYNNKEFGLMPILGDALEDAGNDAAIVKHCKCRYHYKGCWLLDIILGRS